MKWHFEKDLEHQLNAIEAVCDLFLGQETLRGEFTLSGPASAEQHVLSLGQPAIGIGNVLDLPEAALLENLRIVQLRNGIAPSATLESVDFTVEMETGTGKTYVYLRTIRELHRRYGFTKFVVVVPSVAIKEGVYKTLQITADHFRDLYGGTPVRYFVYDSADLGEVRDFATSDLVNVMVVTVAAINKQEVNNLYKPSEKTGDERPLDLIRATHPIIIVDEPQSVDGGLKGRGRSALQAMNPLCTLRYSATHIDPHNQVYRLDAIDAYEKRLVKQIEVASAQVHATGGHPFVRLVGVSATRRSVTAQIEVFDSGESGRRVIMVNDGDDLEQRTGLTSYAGIRIGTITARAGGQLVELRPPTGEVFLRPGDAWGDVDESAVQREMIRRTIREHFDKERSLRGRGIKVLTLFFVDAVDRYRIYADDGSFEKGEYARMFEEEYVRLARHPDYSWVVSDGDPAAHAAAAHNGYFSKDRRGRWTETAEGTQSQRENAARAYRLIMQEKELLLNLSTPLRFIFSHSALREGWDNPNVFQVCALRFIQGLRQRRQIIGRGLRLCVDELGQRVRDSDINRLTVVANESFEDFAENLQQEIEEETGIRFGVVQPHQFASIPFSAGSGDTQALGFEGSQEIWEQLRLSGHLRDDGRVTDTLRQALLEGRVPVPPRFAGIRPAILEILTRLAGRLRVRNADDRTTVRPAEAVFVSTDFRELWSGISQKTSYRVSFDTDSLVSAAINALRDARPVRAAYIEWRTARLSVGRAGVEAVEGEGNRTRITEELPAVLPDLLAILQERTRLTRRTLYRILSECGRLGDFKKNPRDFVEIAADAIGHCKSAHVVNGIGYEPQSPEAHYAIDRLRQELTGYRRNALSGVRKSVLDHVLYESETERAFAERLERDASVKVYLKLPRWYQIPTPVGSYTPDWAVLMEIDGRERLCLVVETKGADGEDALRPTELAKVTCGRAHFSALRIKEPRPVYEVVSSFDDLLDRVG